MCNKKPTTVVHVKRKISNWEMAQPTQTSAITQGPDSGGAFQDIVTRKASVTYKINDDPSKLILKCGYSKHITSLLSY